MDSYARRFIPVHRLLYAKNVLKSDLTDWPGAITVRSHGATYRDFILFYI